MSAPLLLRRAAVLLAVLAFAGCAADLRPISSAPPVAKVTIAAPFKIYAWAGYMPPIKFSLILPAGVYQPTYEDDKYYYYQAPAKLVVNDFSSLLYDGGIYMARGSRRPTGWYYVNEDGTQSTGDFVDLPPYR